MIRLILFVSFSHSFHIVSISICLVSQSVGLNVAFFGNDLFTESLCSLLNPYILYFVFILFTKSFYSLPLVNLAFFNQSLYSLLTPYILYNIIIRASPYVLDSTLITLYSLLKHYVLY